MVKAGVEKFLKRENMKTGKTMSIRLDDEELEALKEGARASGESLHSFTLALIKRNLVSAALEYAAEQQAASAAYLAKHSSSATKPKKGQP